MITRLILTGQGTARLVMDAQTDMERAIFALMRDRATTATLIYAAKRWGSTTVDSQCQSVTIELDGNLNNPAQTIGPT